LAGDQLAAEYNELPAHERGATGGARDRVFTRAIDERQVVEVKHDEQCVGLGLGQHLV
jgi:hypothetical protein